LLFANRCLFPICGRERIERIAAWSRRSLLQKKSAPSDFREEVHTQTQDRKESEEQTKSAEREIANKSNNQIKRGKDLLVNVEFGSLSLFPTLVFPSQTARFAWSFWALSFRWGEFQLKLRTLKGKGAIALSS
jgi:Sec-independent protein translocase protein TatA